MSIANVISAVEGIGYGLAFTEMKRLGDSMYAGRNIWSGTLFQEGQVSNALALADKACTLAGYSPISLVSRVILYLTPVALALVTKDWNEGVVQKAETPPLCDEFWRPIAIFIQDHISDICQVAALVSSVALIFFGNIAFGVASCAMVGLGFVNRASLFPDEIRQFIQEYSAPAAYITGLFTGNFFNILFSLTNIFSYSAGRCYKWMEAKREVPEFLKPNLEAVQRFLEGEAELEVNRDYILWPTYMPEVDPNTDIQNLVEQFQEIMNPDFEMNPHYQENIEALRKKFSDDRRFKERICSDPALKTDEELIAIAKSQLEDCIQRIKGHCIAAGAPTKYESLIEQLKFITQKLPKNPLVNRVDALIKLIVAGAYCGPRIGDDVEEIYDGLVGQSECATTHSKILNCLQSERKRISEGLYASIFQLQQGHSEQNESCIWSVLKCMIGWLGYLVRWDDPHNLHHFQNLVREEFRLGSKAAENDALAQPDYLLKLLLSSTLGKRIEKWFWQRHSHDEIVSLVSSCLGNEQIPPVEITAWWIECIKDMNIPDEKKAVLKDELACAYAKPGTFSPKFACGMLLGMGILQIKQA